MVTVSAAPDGPMNRRGTRCCTRRERRAVCAAVSTVGTRILDSRVEAHKVIHVSPTAAMSLIRYQSRNRREWDADLGGGWCRQ